jgi:hypothetical protein
MRIITKNGKQTSPNLNNCELRDCCIQMMFDLDIAMGRHSGTWKQLCSMVRGSIVVLIRTFIILAIPPFTTHLYLGEPFHAMQVKRIQDRRALYEGRYKISISWTQGTKSSHGLAQDEDEKQGPGKG